MNMLTPRQFEQALRGIDQRVLRGPLIPTPPAEIPVAKVNLLRSEPETLDEARDRIMAAIANDARLRQEAHNRQVWERTHGNGRVTREYLVRQSDGKILHHVATEDMTTPGAAFQKAGR